jgi:hypothetical protein
LIEITGFAHTQWREDFIEKIGVLRDSVKNPILILTYPENIKDREIFTCSNKDVWIDSIFNKKGILDKIKLFKAIKHVNDHILKGAVCNC